MRETADTAGQGEHLQWAVKQPYFPSIPSLFLLRSSSTTHTVIPLASEIVGWLNCLICGVSVCVRVSVRVELSAFGLPHPCPSPSVLHSSRKPLLCFTNNNYLSKSFLSSHGCANCSSCNTERLGMKHNFNHLQCSLSAISQTCVSSEATKLAHTHAFSHTEYRTNMDAFHLRLPSCEYVFTTNKQTNKNKQFAPMMICLQCVWGLLSIFFG